MASHLVFDSNMSQIPTSKSFIIPLFREEELVKLHLKDSKVDTYWHLTSMASSIWPACSHDCCHPSVTLGRAGQTVCLMVYGYMPAE